MKIHILQHVPFEGLGSIHGWLEERKASVSWTRFFADTRLPDPAQIDMVIALGGPMSVNDEIDLPWLADEKRFIAATIRLGKPVLGICLGAQLIANALGGRVFPNSQKEIGWHEIERVEGASDCFQFPPKATVFHWHGETFDLPPGAALLASSAACKHQAFQLGANVIGLQFHLETTPATADAIIAGCRDELVVGAFVQSEAALRAVEAVAYSEINALMVQVLDYLMPWAQNDTA